MKKFMMVAMALIVACSASFADNSEFKQQLKERKELRKADKKELNEKATKAARKETGQGRLESSRRFAASGETARPLLSLSDGV